MFFLQAPVKGLFCIILLFSPFHSFAAHKFHSPNYEWAFPKYLTFKILPRLDWVSLCVCMQMVVWNKSAE